jgi:hypothetical protein
VSCSEAFALVQAINHVMMQMLINCSWCDLILLLSTLIRILGLNLATTE